MRRNRIDLAGRSAIVTGGARGLGRAVAERLGASGARVALWDVDGALAEETARALGEGTRGFAVDVSDAGSVDAAMAATRAWFGDAALLVCSAGIGGEKHVAWDYPVDVWSRVLAVNLTGTWLCCRAAAPAMVAAGWGRIVTIASMAGKEGNPNTSAYSASKGGVIALTKSLGRELARTGVLANCVVPTLFDTELVRETDPRYIDFLREKIPMGRFGRPEELAAMVAWLCSDECSYNNGAVFDLSGGRATY